MDPIVFDIWWVAQHAEFFAKLMTESSASTQLGESDTEMILESDPELTEVLASASRSASAAAAKKDSVVPSTDNTSVSVGILWE